MHGTARNGSEWHGKDEKGQDSKDKNLLWKGEGVGEGGVEVRGDIVKESSTSERRMEEKGRNCARLAWRY